MSAITVEDGADLDVEQVAQRWGVDLKALQEAVELVSQPLDGAEFRSSGKLRNELMQIALKAESFACAIEAAKPSTIFFWLACDPSVHPGALVGQPDLYRRPIVKYVRDCARQARTAAEQVIVTRRPGADGRSPTSPPTVKERQVVSAMADVWHKSTGRWPNVTDWKGGKHKEDAREGNEGGRFVIASAKLLGLSLTAQRLATILQTLNAPTAET